MPTPVSEKNDRASELAHTTIAGSESPSWRRGERGRVEGRVDEGKEQKRRAKGLDSGTKRWPANVWSKSEQGVSQASEGARATVAPQEIIVDKRKDRGEEGGGKRRKRRGVWWSGRWATWDCDVAPSYYTRFSQRRLHLP